MRPIEYAHIFEIALMQGNQIPQLRLFLVGFQPVIHEATIDNEIAFGKALSENRLGSFDPTVLTGMKENQAQKVKICKSLRFLDQMSLRVGSPTIFETGIQGNVVHSQAISTSHISSLKISK